MHVRKEMLTFGGTRAALPSPPAARREFRRRILALGVRLFEEGRPFGVGCIRIHVQTL